MAIIPFAHERHPALIVGHKDEEGRMDLVLSEIIKIGYSLVDEDWMVGGSQEISIYRFERGRDILTLQAETYEDLKLFGHQKLLEEVRHLSPSSIGKLKTG
jgi:hypothetical protein